MDETETNLDTVTDVNPSNLKYTNSSSSNTQQFEGNINSNVFDELNFYYDMSGDKHLIIFNHFSYRKTRYFGRSHPSSRKGTHEDVKSLQHTFQDLGFKVRIHQDLDYESIVNEVIAVTKADHTATSCIAVAILTHGSTDGELTACDRPYNFKDILTRFENGHQSLVSKPKLFFIQACRGDSMDAGRVVTDGQIQNASVMPTHANFLVLYSTVEDYVSWRDIRGSWLIQELCDVITKYKESMDLLRILTVVNYRVARERASYSTIKELNGKKQMPETRFTLTKLLRF